MRDISIHLQHEKDIAEAELFITNELIKISQFNNMNLDKGSPLRNKLLEEVFRLSPRGVKKEIISYYDFQKAYENIK